MSKRSMPCSMGVGGYEWAVGWLGRVRAGGLSVLHVKEVGALCSTGMGGWVGRVGCWGGAESWGCKWCMCAGGWRQWVSVRCGWVSHGGHRGMAIYLRGSKCARWWWLAVAMASPGGCCLP